MHLAARDYIPRPRPSEGRRLIPRCRRVVCAPAFKQAVRAFPLWAADWALSGRRLVSFSAHDACRHEPLYLVGSVADAASGPQVGMLSLGSADGRRCRRSSGLDPRPGLFGGRCGPGRPLRRDSPRPVPYVALRPQNLGSWLLLTSTSDRARVPAQLKHITKRRKRN